MSPALYHEHTRVPVTALAICDPLLLAAEGPHLRFYHNENSRLLATEQIFKAQVIHGLSVHSTSSRHAIVIIWGGAFVRILELSISPDTEVSTPDILQLSSTLKLPDWILDLSFCPFDSLDVSTRIVGVCAAVTAHNALFELTIRRQDRDGVSDSQPLVVSLSELTSSSRSILYSAHLLWDSSDHILVAAGTAFGEIIFWSWTRNLNGDPNSHIHRVFLGHEGSIFGVQISKELGSASSRGTQRLLASCSDDRTIRIWDVSTVSNSGDAPVIPDGDLDAQRTRHTGFSNASFDVDSSGTACLAIGWGHISRVWTVQFLDSQLFASGNVLLSTGEDSTSRTWKLISKDGRLDPIAEPSSCDLLQMSNAAYHRGKNIWSVAIRASSPDFQQVVCGAADSKITARPLTYSSKALNEFSVEDISSMAQASADAVESLRLFPAHKSSKMAEFFRSYTFLDSSSFLLTTNAGKVFLESLYTVADNSGHAISNSRLIHHLEELSGYSVCAGNASLGIAFVASSQGGIYVYQKVESHLSKVHNVNGKVGSMFATGTVLLVTLVGQKVAQLLYVDFTNVRTPSTSRTVSVPLSELQTGLVITSMVYVSTAPESDYIILGFRRGSVAIYTLSTTQNTNSGTTEENTVLTRIIEQVHGKETVTSMQWIPSPSSDTASTKSSTGHLVSVGRDGCVAAHYIDLSTSSILLVHRLTLPTGSNIEGLYSHHDHLMVYGFSSKKFFLYDNSTEEEVMSVDTGGAHRSWAFQPYSLKEGGGTLVWTRASSMHVFSQNGPNHQVIRSGGHGREIKTVAVSTNTGSGTSRRLIATGAEDTDIKIFEQEDGDLICRRTLRKHTTGLQHLQWSEDGEYLFSSGGCEEFYIWRVRILPSFISIGVVCESIYVPESEHSDLRITSFDVQRREEPEQGFIIAMVFSDSNVRVYSYDPTVAVKWHTLAKGVYFTSCLTQCVFLSSRIILTTGTDGHAVFWPLSSETCRPHASTPSQAGALTWKNPTRIHQNTSKILTSFAFANDTTLLVSGGDDGSLAFLLAKSLPILSSYTTSGNSSYTHPPIIVTRAHASAITASVIISHQSGIFVLTSGNDQWVRLWEVIPATSNTEDHLGIKRVKKIKTNVADVSSMAILEEEDRATKVLICGVGTEVIRVEDWDR